MIFKEHCEDEFIYLAKNDPHKLEDLIKNDLVDRPDLLTFAAEAVCWITDVDLAIKIATPLLTHPDPVVREGAVYGIIFEVGYCPDIKKLLQNLYKTETSPGVRESIRYVLEKDGEQWPS